MINLQQFSTDYPCLASFNNDPNSPTYTRRSKTGKMVVVRKGKQKGKGLALTGGVLLGVGAGNTIREGVQAGADMANASGKARKALYTGSKAAGLAGAGIIGINTYKYIKRKVNED